MKVAIYYPLLKKGDQYPQLSQNRQFRYMYSPETRIYPMVIASAATLIHKDGNDVLYLDSINERMPLGKSFVVLKNFNPGMIVIETKAPMIKKHWKIISELKKRMAAKIVLVGDHISFFPEESLKNSKVDYCVAGGDYDYALMKLVKHLNGKGEMPGGVYYKKSGKIVNTGKPEFVDNLDKLPFIDRDLTKWELYYEAYLYKPCTYILTGRGCGGTGKNPGVCTFCIWQHSFWRCKARLRSPANVADEIEQIVTKYKVKEIFDDNEGGAVWDKKWLKHFYLEMKKRGLIGKVYISSNARADSFDKESSRLMKKIGYRLMKVGLESGNDKTLKRINKLETIKDIKQGIKHAKDAGLIIMLTSMVGYPWEDEKDAANTYKVAKELMLYKTRFGDVLQSSVIVPYPGTPLYKQALKNKWFIVDPKDYEKFDMSQPVLKTSIDTNKWCQKMWKVHLEPMFIIKSFLSLRNLDSIKMALRGLRSLVGHLKDYEK